MGYWLVLYSFCYLILFSLLAPPSLPAVFALVSLFRHRRIRLLERPLPVIEQSLGFHWGVAPFSSHPHGM